MCASHAAAYVRLRDETRGVAAENKWLGGIVPHAGWICSGAVAGQALAVMAESRLPSGPVDLVVVFGAVHTPLPLEAAALDSFDRWLVPGGDSEISVELRRTLAEQSRLFCTDDRFHATEHAIEVELPLIELAFPSARLLPIEVPLIDVAGEIGIGVARAVAALSLRAVFLASSDLTHYGVNYRFAPAGLGPGGLAWAMDNDRRLLDRVAGLEVEKIVPEVRGQNNACGGGAIAAMLAACRERGATQARTIWHTNSFETLANIEPQSPVNAVGYAAVVVG
jgi:AmmeMemoRadiSam system protein B